MAGNASLVFLTLIGLVFGSATAYTVKNPTISLLSPQGLRFSYPHEEGLSLVAFHYSVNALVPGVAPGEYNYDVTTTDGESWVHENTEVVVAAGDTVHYWVYVLYYGGGYQLLEQSWDASGDPATQPPTQAGTSAPSTRAPQTEPPVLTNPPAGTTNPPAGTTNPPAGTTRKPGGGLPSQCSVYPCDASCDSTLAPCNGLIFQEEFDYLNLDVWEHEITAGGGGNWEFQFYTNNRSNSYVRDGKFFIKPTLTSDHYGEAFLSTGTLDLWGASPSNLCTGNAWYGCQRVGSATGIINPIQSARVRTVDSFSFKYGRIELEAKLPTGDWLWPAVWLLPRHNAYGDWPASGEIDLIESRGNPNLVDGDGVSAGVDQMGSTLHWGPFWPMNGWPKTHETKNLDGGETFGTGFHKFTLDWSKDDMKFYVDDELTLVVDPANSGHSGFWDFGEFSESAPGIDNPWRNSPNKMAPFDEEFYLILNVAVGGVNYFGDGLTNSPNPKPWTNDSPQAAYDFWSKRNEWEPTWDGEEAAMQINYIRVYAREGETTYHKRDR